MLGSSSRAVVAAETLSNMWDNLRGNERVKEIPVDFVGRKKSRSIDVKNMLFSRNVIFNSYLQITYNQMLHVQPCICNIKNHLSMPFFFCLHYFIYLFKSETLFECDLC